MRASTWAIVFAVAAGIGASVAPISASIQVSEFVSTLGGEQAAFLALVDGPIPGADESHVRLGVTNRVAAGCSITVLADRVTDQELLAHESCHCVLDYEVLTAYGYRTGTTRAEVERMERRAQACAAWLTAADKVEERMEARRTGRKPTW